MAAMMGLLAAASGRRCGADAWRMSTARMSVLSLRKKIPVHGRCLSILTNDNVCRYRSRLRPAAASRVPWPQPQPQGRRRGLSLFMSAGDEDEVENDGAKTLQSLWHVPGLKKEVQRVILRCHKKIGKASDRLLRAQQDNPPGSVNGGSEESPDLELLEMELRELQARLRHLNLLEEKLQPIKKKDAVLPEDVATLAVDLGLDDQPPPRPARGPPKPKGPRGGSTNGPRKPYRCYYAADGTEIRVGKRANDNDELSLRAEHRDGRDWWMHASGCPGSHVVIRDTAEALAPEVKLDAAALAARQSKCHGAVIKVSLTRCRDVRKPPGAKPGLVMLTGNVETVVVNMKEAEKRLERLDTTVVA